MTTCLGHIFQDALPSFDYMFEQAIVYGRGGMVKWDEMNDRASFYPVEMLAPPRGIG